MFWLTISKGRQKLILILRLALVLFLLAVLLPQVMRLLGRGS